MNDRGAHYNIIFHTVCCTSPPHVQQITESATSVLLAEISYQRAVGCPKRKSALPRVCHSAQPGFVPRQFCKC